MRRVGRRPPGRAVLRLRPRPHPGRALSHGLGLRLPVPLRGLRPAALSRRWPAEPRWSRRASLPCPRWSATPPSSSIPTASTTSPAASSRVLTDDALPRRARGAGTGPGEALQLGALGEGHPRGLHEGARPDRRGGGHRARPLTASRRSIPCGSPSSTTGSRECGAARRCSSALARLFPGGADLHPRPPPRQRGAELESREIHTTFVQRLPGVADPLPPVPAPLPRRGRDLRSARFRSRGVELALRGQGGRGAARRRARLLLPHPDALRLGPLRRLLRPRPPPGSGAFRSCRSWPQACGPGTSPPRHRVHALRRQQRLRGGPHPPLLRPRRRGDPAPGRHRLLHARTRRAGHASTSWSRPSRPTSGSTSCSRPIAARAGRSRSWAAGPRKTASAVGSARGDLRGPGHGRALARPLPRRCRALLMPGVEDFGIAPLEAMACGRPAVVFGEGGGLETVIPRPHRPRLPRADRRPPSAPPLTGWRPSALIERRSGRRQKRTDPRSSRRGSELRRAHPRRAPTWKRAPSHDEAKDPPHGGGLRGHGPPRHEPRLGARLHPALRRSCAASSRSPRASPTSLATSC